LNQALKNSPKNKDVIAELDKVRNAEKEYKNKSKAMWQGLFNNNKEPTN